MKKIIRTSAICLAGAMLVAGGTVSCVDPINVGDEFLEKAPGVDVDINTIFSKGENAKYFLWNLYNHIGSPLTFGARMNQCPTETLADTFQNYCGWGGSNAYYSGNIQPGAGDDKFPFLTINDYRLGVWDGIRKGWIIIENIDRVPDLSDAEKSQIKGETYLIIATRYFDALRNYGGLPLVDHAYAPTDIMEDGRATVEDTVKFIDELIDKAIEEQGFPWGWATEADRNAWAGRLTKSGAVALRAKLWNFAASPLFNDDAPYMDGADEPLHIWYGARRQELWQTALAACETFFSQNASNGNLYALIQPATQDENGYADAFRAAYWHRGNSEKIIELHHATKPGGGWSSAADLQNATQFGMINATVEYMEMFGMADGKNYPWAGNADIYGNNPGNVDIFAGRDPRLYETLLVIREKQREQYQGKEFVQIWQGGDFNLGSDMERFKSGLPLYKWILDYWKAAEHLISYSYIRMADMHLLYAEALAETGNLQKACDEINKVRARVGLGKIEVMNPSLDLTNNKANLIAEILRERACEFGMEDERLYDIIRRKKFDSFTTSLHELVVWRKTADGQKWDATKEGMNIDRNNDGTPDEARVVAGEPWPSFIYEKRVISTGARVWWTGGWSNKYLLSPFPRDEVNKGYGLTQNPGW